MSWCSRRATGSGGRIWTSRDLGVPADLGASWIHGFEDNPISRLAKRHGIGILRTGYLQRFPRPLPVCRPL